MKSTESRSRVLSLAPVLLGFACAGLPPPPHQGPTLPLLEAPTAKEGPTAGKPASNARRAWQYKPEMVEPLSKLGKAISVDSSLPKRARGMMFTVVASRNRCLY